MSERRLVTIKEFRALDEQTDLDACLILEVEALGKIVEKEHQGRKYRIQKIGVKDYTGSMYLNLFDNMIGKMQMENNYQICNVGVKTISGYNQIQIRQKTSITEIPMEEPKAVAAAAAAAPAKDSSSGNTDDWFKTKQKQILAEQAAPVPDEFAAFAAANYPRLQAWEKWIVEHDPTAAANGQRLGLILNQLNNQWIQEHAAK